MSDPVAITVTIAGVVVALALLLALRHVWRRSEREGLPWWRLRVGFFVERDLHEPKEDDDEHEAET